MSKSSGGHNFHPSRISEREKQSRTREANKSKKAFKRNKDNLDLNKSNWSI